MGKSEQGGMVEAFHGGPFDGSRPEWDSKRAEDKGVVDPMSGAFYERAPQLDAPGERAWRHAPELNFKEHPDAWRERMAGTPDSPEGVDTAARRAAPVSLSTMSVKAESKTQPVTLGQLRALGERAAEQGFSDDTPLRALVFMRGTVKALEVRSE